MGSKIIRDAVHGDLVFSESELRLVDTRAYQRLRGIKQLGTSSLVYPSATHTRFEHSLGTAGMAKRILESLGQSESLRVTREDARVTKALALVHDVTHVPFGHTFEDERRVFERHDESVDRLTYYLRDSDLGEELRRQDLAEPLWQALQPSARPTLAREIVCGTICADLLDYLRRDAQCCGLSQDYDDRLFRYFARDGDRLVLNLRRRGIFRPDALSELVNLLRLRYNLTERVYYHHAKVAAGAMISKALELCLREGALEGPEVLACRDDSFLDLLARRGRQVAGVEGLLADLAGRQLVKRVYCQTIAQPGLNGMSAEAQEAFERLYHYDEGRAREHLESALESQLGLPQASVIVYCPSSKMALKEASVLVNLDGDTPQMLSALHHPEVEVLRDKHRSLWRFYVFMRRACSADFDRAGRLCEELLGYPNLLGQQREGEMAFGRR